MTVTNEVTSPLSFHMLKDGKIVELKNCYTISEAQKQALELNKIKIIPVSKSSD